MVYLFSFRLKILIGVFAAGSFALDIQPPSGWQSQTKVPPGIARQYISPIPSGKFSPNLNISQKKLAPSFADSLKTSKQLGDHVEGSQARVFPMYKVLERKQRKVGSADGTLLIFSYAYGVADLVAFQFIFRNGGEMVNVVYTCLLGDLDRFRPEFEKSLATLKDDDTMAAAKP